MGRDSNELRRAGFLVEVEGQVQRANRELHVLFVQVDAGIHLGRRDHLDVDTLVAVDAEHLDRITDVRPMTRSA